MLEYLVTSKTKLNLLKLLWQQQLRTTASTLSRLADLSFPAVHAELQNMEELGLVKSETAGNTKIYSANKDFKLAKVLCELLNNDNPVDFNSSRDLKMSSKEIILNMSFYGAPLGQTGTPNIRLSLEETLAHALRLAHENPTVARTLPVLLHANKNKIDLQQLRFQAELLKEKQALGFFLDLTASLSNHKKYEQFANVLHDKRFKKNKNFFSHVQGKFGTLLTKKNTPTIAKKWNYLMNMELSTFQSLFDKFLDVKP